MKKSLFITASLCASIFSAGQAQVTSVSSGNGITVDNTNPAIPSVKLGSTLTGHVNFDLGASYNFNFLKGSTNYLSLLNNGNLLMGTTTDNGNKLQLNGSASISNSLSISGSLGVTGNVSQGGGSTFSFGNGIQFNTNLGSRIFSGQMLVYQSNSATDQQLFSNSIGNGFGGNLVTINPGNSVLSPNQLALKVWGARSVNNPNNQALGLCVNMDGFTGIGTATPTAQLHTTGTVRFAGLASSSSPVNVIVSDANGNISYYSASNFASSSGGSIGAISTWQYSGNNVASEQKIGTTSAYDLPFIANNTERMRISSTTGSIMLGTATDNGSRLQVSGSATISGALVIAGNVSQGGGSTFSFGNGLIFNAYDQWAAARIFAGGQILYQSNGTGNQHYFVNQIGTGFTGTLVTMDPGPYSGLPDNQLTMKVLGRSGTIGLNVNMLGYTGIGTITPTAQLHTTGTVRFAGLTATATPLNVLVSDASGNVGYVSVSTISGSGASSIWAPVSTGSSTDYSTNSGNIIVGSQTDNGSKLQVMGTGYFSGSVGIGAVPGGSNTAGYALAVNGSSIFTKAVVKLNANWPDYVFSPSYPLLPITDLQQYIQKNNHLPDMPSADEVEKNGIDLGDNQAVLLKKIEELTLYIIEQDKEIRELRNEGKKLGSLQQQIDDLKKLLKKE